MTTQTQNNEPAAPAQDENSIMAERRAKLAALREQGVAYPNDFRPKTRLTIVMPNTTEWITKRSKQPKSRFVLQVA